MTYSYVPRIYIVSFFSLSFLGLSTPQSDSVSQTEQVVAPMVDSIVNQADIEGVADMQKTNINKKFYTVLTLPKAKKAL